MQEKREKNSQLKLRAQDEDPLNDKERTSTVGKRQRYIRIYRSTGGRYL